MARLARRVRPFLLRRLKRDVVKDLPQDRAGLLLRTDGRPGRSIPTIAFRDPERGSFGGGEQGLAKSRMLVLTALLRLRQVCCGLRLLPTAPSDPLETPTSAASSGKVQLFGELLDEIVDGGHRVLVFSQFTRMLDLLGDELESRGLVHCRLDGSTTDRQGVVQRFQNDTSIPVFLISLKAGGWG